MTMPKFDPRFSLGHVIQLVVMFVTLVSLWTATQMRLDQVEKAQKEDREDGRKWRELFDSHLSALSIDEVRVSTMLTDHLTKHQ